LNRYTASLPGGRYLFGMVLAAADPTMIGRVIDAGARVQIFTSADPLFTLDFVDSVVAQD